MHTRPAAPFAAALLGLLLLWPARDAEAQAHRYGAGWTVGGSYVTELNVDATGPSPTAIDPGLGFLLGLHLERWYGASGRFGVRTQGAYLQPRVDWTTGERKIDVASADVSVLMRLADPRREGAVLPYLTAGVGGIWYDLGTGDDSFFAGADAYHDGASRVLPLVALGLGADVPSPWSWDSSPVRFRVEVADHVTFGSPLRRLADGSRHGPVHHVRFTLGAYSAVGLLGR